MLFFLFSHRPLSASGFRSDNPWGTGDRNQLKTIRKSDSRTGPKRPPATIYHLQPLTAATVCCIGSLPLPNLSKPSGAKQRRRMGKDISLLQPFLVRFSVLLFSFNSLVATSTADASFRLFLLLKTQKNCQIFSVSFAAFLGALGSQPGGVY